MTQLLKKDVSPKHATPNPADSHRPDSVYRPNPFPINPVVGYPSAPVTTYHYPPPHSNYDNNVPPPQYSSYDTTSSYPHSYTYGQPSDGYDTSTVAYPPYAHHSDSGRYSNNYDDDTNNNSYNTGSYNNHNNHYNNTSDDNNNNDDNDNDNDNEDDDEDDDDDNDDTDPEATDKKNNASDAVTKKSKPSRRRFVFRLIQLLASIGALGFIAGASSVSTLNRELTIIIISRF